jgi:soluble lytic murein transglycosylase-like protein
MEAGMDSLRNYVLVGALLGSLLLASFGYKVTASVQFPAPAQQPGEARSSDKQNQSQGNSDSEVNAKKKKKAEKVLVDSKCKLSKKYPESILQWCKEITHYAESKNLDPGLIAAVMLQESGGNPSAYSKSGAVGLMQVMPRDGLAASFMCINGPCFANRPSIQELQDPDFNIDYGTKMLAGLVSKQGNVRDALRAYGPMDVGYYYADKVLGIYQSYSK